jgi:hypothetical protein
MRAHFTDPTSAAIAEIEFLVDTEGRLYCIEIMVRSEIGGEPLTESFARLPIQTMMENAVKAIACQIVDGDGNLRLELADPAFVTALSLGRAARPRKVRITLENLAEVATVYTKAETDGRNPTETVKHHLGTSYSTAAHRVQRARRTIDPSTGKPFLPAVKRKSTGKEVDK